MSIERTSRAIGDSRRPASDASYKRASDDEASRKDLWDLFASAPEPLGYDPRILGGEDHRDPKITVLRLTPWRLSAGGEAWRAA